MKTIALRFGEHFSPECGTIAAHQQIIDANKYVWYGKMGKAVAAQVIDCILNAEEARILLINSGKCNRYWAYIEDISYTTPPLDEIPEYYRDISDKFNTWFKIKRFEVAPRDIMSKCIVISSGNKLGEVSRHSMSPYFIIEINETEVR